MSDQGWERWPPKSKPIRVSGGIRARSGRGAIGKSWWSKRFIEVMESIGGNRLTRGRSYARAGQVLELAVSPGEVTAAVQGSRRQPYRVTVGLARFPEPVWETVEHALAEQAIYSARLLAGEMPPDIEDVFAAAGAPLFPQRLSDVRMSCSCPDHAQVCKHLAATFYLLAEAFDDDPFQILHWRGRDREALLSRLRSLRGGAADPGPGTPAAPAQVVGAKVALAEVIGPSLAESVDRLSPDRFWLQPVPLPRRPATLDTEPDLLLRQLPPPGPGLGGPRLLDALRPAYQRFASADGASDSPAAQDSDGG
jgi:uncharacterized Zn finger protein